MTSVLPLTGHARAVMEAMSPARNRLPLDLSATARQPDDRFPCAFASLVAAVECAFCEEENLMEAAAYPGVHAQRRDNALLLRALHHAAAQVETGNITIGREVTAALPDLLSLHHLSALRMLSHGVTGQRAGMVTRNGRLRVYAGSRRREGEGGR